MLNSPCWITYYPFIIAPAFLLCLPADAARHLSSILSIMAFLFLAFHLQFSIRCPWLLYIQLNKIRTYGKFCFVITSLIIGGTSEGEQRTPYCLIKARTNTVTLCKHTKVGRCVTKYSIINLTNELLSDESLRFKNNSVVSNTHRSIFIPQLRLLISPKNSSCCYV